MAENIILKARIAKMQIAEPIANATQLASVVWTDLPLTLRDDAVEIIEGDPEESEVFSHENDSAEDYDIAGAGVGVSGSFIKVKYDDLVKLIGGKKVGANADVKFHKSGKKLLLNKSLKFILKNGGEIVVPNAKGYVNTSLSIGYGGVSKFPFKFKALVASSDWDVDIIW